MDTYFPFYYYFPYFQSRYQYQVSVYAHMMTVHVDKLKFKLHFFFLIFLPVYATNKNSKGWEACNLLEKIMHIKIGKRAEKYASISYGYSLAKWCVFILCVSGCMLTCHFYVHLSLAYFRQPQFSLYTDRLNLKLHAKKKQQNNIETNEWFTLLMCIKSKIRISHSLNSDKYWVHIQHGFASYFFLLLQRNMPEAIKAATTFDCGLYWWNASTAKWKQRKKNKVKT